MEKLENFWRNFRTWLVVSPQLCRVLTWPRDDWLKHSHKLGGQCIRSWLKRQKWPNQNITNTAEIIRQIHTLIYQNANLAARIFLSQVYRWCSWIVETSVSDADPSRWCTRFAIFLKGSSKRLLWTSSGIGTINGHHSGCWMRRASRQGWLAFS